MEKVVEAIRSIRPNAEFVIHGEDLGNIEWHVLEGKIPTKAEILKAVEAIKAQEISKQTADAIAREALLQKLGITADEAALLLS